MDEEEYTDTNNLEILKRLTDVLNEKDEAVKKSERILRAILESSPVGIALVDKRKIIWTNEAMAQTFGYTEEELNGMNVRTLYPNNEEYMRVGEKLYDDQFGGKKKGELKVNLMKKDGSSFVALLRAAFIDPNNELMKYMKESDLMIIAIVIDLVELKSICEGYLYAEA